MGWNSSLQPEWLSVLSGDHDQRFVRLATSSGRVFALGEQALTATLGKFTLPHVPSARGGTAFDLVLAAFDEAPTVR